MPKPEKSKPTRVFQSSSVRDLLREKAQELLQSYLDTIVEARAAGEFKDALEAQWKLIEHMPADAAGNRIIDSSVDKQAKEAGPKRIGPQIQIGIKMGGSPEPKTLAPHVIDVEPEEN